MGGIAWKRLGLVAALLLGGTGMAQTAPPAVGSSHHFLDPVFRGTIVCDTLDAVQAIAGAEQLDQIYAAYYMTTNAIGEPICMAIALTALGGDTDRISPPHAARQARDRPVLQYP